MATAKRNKSYGIYKRKGSPFWQYTHPITKLRKSTGTTNEEQAKAFIAKLTLDSFNGVLGKKPSISLDNLLARYMIEQAQHLKSYKNIDHYNENLLKHLGGNTLIETITVSDLSIYKAKRRAEPHRRGKDYNISNSTLNRELENLRVVLNIGKSWGYNAPEINFKEVMLREPDARTRYLDSSQIDILLSNCNYVIHDAVEFALYTGLRAGNIFNLKWSQVNFFAKEIIVQIKSNIPGGKTLRLPISQKMYEILKRQTLGEYVFKNKRGKRIKYYYDYFQKACDDSNIADFRFHDLRHTAATQLRMAGVPLEIVQEILGHTNISTTRKYAKVARVEISDALNNLAQNLHNQQNQKQGRGYETVS